MTNDEDMKMLDLISEKAARPARDLSHNAQRGVTRVEDEALKRDANEIKNLLFYYRSMAMYRYSQRVET
jgi:hypothetical protein